MTNKLVEETPYHPGYEDAGFEPIPFAGYVKVQNELTDEEIVSLINKHIDYVPDDDGMKLVGVMDFARAILRKAREKC